ncbi:MAG: hypothetical protein A2W52_04790 [Candidatus Taylorbacteria bacterium RIFCSPHIGHO2_02_49_25]|uniref:Methyltransferase domain-containing protein n=1 Tax=Candidatus Taylorbacteria bacterium RIFCSPHIGHO2_02_49_25 TaxID=1802305 RepID=A0A1G2MFC8_9BACT|nr:MAG: hypothetical protein A2759_01980 [Candidatus Taylorbacteria bacterium RIFCSPHIGHO2_01_FULL_49_60]OHA22610.1 MAG: hypothetical protein A2W52_04790 [Candidatus Taylorbacteria bacterium RIFCSPHIGHO2_02_49_25]OHA36046.1 MAG: hypothetical protein A2W65_01635 [Candidatus Taylorbacteria bacterium RIFCSPLOWO2_02_50_13]OHA41309.1 MAG: hypothetical protein A3H73_02410 [Candidatus Taylorbacteria bacterium RIFCSPLOWO2_02_FULL_50_120]OHA47590.1 MAG: hypothetical protein A3G61_04320 [Candidatus Taylo
MKTNLQFALNFLRRPAQNASLVPSSTSASKAMLDGIDFSAIHSIVELGPGTGVFTREILRRCAADTKVLLIEIENVYAAFLKRQFGGRVIVEHSSAHLLDVLIEKHGLEKIDLIVSGLPVALPQEIRGSFLQSIRAHTERGTQFRFFTYNPPLMRRMYRGFSIRKLSVVYRNFPPLWVYGIH